MCWGYEFIKQPISQNHREISPKCVVFTILSTKHIHLASNGVTTSLESLAENLTSTIGFGIHSQGIGVL